MASTPGAYIPPSPPDAATAGRRGLSLWAYLGIGCLAVFLLMMGALGILIYKFSKTLGAPVNKTEVLAALGPVPVYPKAQFDEMTTKIARATEDTMKLSMGGKDFVGVAFHTPAAPKDVIGWYDVQLTVLGYRALRTRANTINSQEGQLQHQYFKKGEAVIVEAQPMPKAQDDTTPDTLIMVMRIQGITKAPPSADKTESKADN